MLWFRNYHEQLKNESPEILQKIKSDYESLYSRQGKGDIAIEFCVDALKHFFGANSKRWRYDAAKQILDQRQKESPLSEKAA